MTIARLDDDAAEVLEQLRAAMPVRMSELGVDVLRAALAAQPQPPREPVHRVRDHLISGPNGEVPVRVYSPGADEHSPVLIWLHGGGFVLGDLELYDPLCRQLAHAARAVLVSVGYRLAPEHPFPAGLDDCYAAVEWTVAHAPLLGGDPLRVAIGGDSAGGSLAMAVCMIARERGPRLLLQLIVYGTALLRISNLEYADLPVLGARDCEWFWQMYASSDADRLSPLCSPLLADDLAGLPPAVVMTAENDPTRDDTEAYAHRLAAAGVRTTLKRYPGVFHGFFSMTAELARAREAMHDAGVALRSAFAEVNDAALR